MKKNIVVGQSGGPTAVINGSLYGVLTEAFRHTDEINHVYGMKNGIEGLLENRIIDLNSLNGSRELEFMRTTPGAYLGSCRHQLPENQAEPVYKKVMDRLQAYNVSCFLYIGGNDSMDTVSKLSRYAARRGSDIRFLGIPKTIDNDLVHTDHTPGFGSAAKYVAATVREIAMDADTYDNKQSVTIVEIMGRHAGWLTAASILARQFREDNPVLIYVPEVSFDLRRFLRQTEGALKKTNNIVICVSEGIHDAAGNLICESSGSVKMDAFGHKMLTGVGKYLENMIRERLSIKTRSIELNVCQRCSSAYLSATDLKEAVEAGAFALQQALAGEGGKMISFLRSSDQPYQLQCCITDVSAICNKEKLLPAEWITSSGADIRDEYLNYVRPLVRGEVVVPKESGVPVFTRLQNMK